ncbi:ParB N-terminal domain-containing protein [Leptospira weilii]|uniref:ParB-like protein n=1 Tax=Leptospira weilii str. UI 13098 TaxID=1088542 RepID=M6QA21_9LEPT|nr:ParB N-terminal domain-containing protein [Leptospira weilii]EMN89463.1 ParB-like protein [Leptospira weilii str. UI 13098]
MEILTKEDITSEIAETILDKIHLSMTKTNPLWQEWVMGEEEPWYEGEINSLSRKGLITVLRSSEKELSQDGMIALSKEFKSLGASFLSQYLKNRAEIVEVSDPSDSEQEDETQKSILEIQSSNVLKAEPTPSQKKAGNYKKNHVRIQGIDISIENRKGSYRSGVDESGKPWRNQIKFDYGYIKRTQGADGDHVDVFVGPDPDSQIVFVVNQKKKDGSFDEHKVMLGFHDEKSAKQGYLVNYKKGWTGLGSIVLLTIPQFKEWLFSKNTKTELKSPKLEFLKSKLYEFRNSNIDLSRLSEKANRLRSVLVGGSVPEEEYLHSVQKSGNSAALIPKQIVVHGKHGNYVSTRLVKPEGYTENHFSLKQELAVRIRPKKYSDRPVYKLSPEDKDHGKLIDHIKKTLLSQGLDSRAKEFVDLAYISDTRQDILDIASDYVDLRGELKESGLSEDESNLFKAMLLAVYEPLEKLNLILKGKRGRPPAPMGTKKDWKDGSTRIKTADGWKPVKKERQVKEEKPTAKKRHLRVIKPSKESRTTKSGSLPTKLPFNQIRTIEQYTAKKDFDRNQINSLKLKIKDGGYDPGFPIIVDKQEGKWTVVAGHHRYEAVKELIAEGHFPSNFEIPIVPKEFASSNDRLASQLSENHRRNVLPTDEAKAYGKMIENGWDAKKISEKLGITIGEVNKRLALNDLTPDLFTLVHKKDKSLPLGVAEVIGLFAKDVNDKPNATMQIRAYKWYVANRSKYPGRGPSVIQNYLKELQSGQFDHFDFDSVATNVQREALRTVSMETAATNRKMLEVMMDSLSKTYQRVLGDNVTSLSPQTIKELAASIAVSADKGVGSSSVIGRLNVIIQDLSIIKDSLQMKLKEIEDDSSMPMMFAKSFLLDIDETIFKANQVKEDYSLVFLK